MIHSSLVAGLPSGSPNPNPDWSAELGYPEALFCLGDLSLTGSDGVVPDIRAAVNFYKVS